MVSGLVTSPEDQSRICLLEASPIRIASKSLMSIKFLLSPSVFEFKVNKVCVAHRADFGVGFLLGHRRLGDLDVLEITERLVGRHCELAVDVDPLLSFLGLLGRGLAADSAQRAGREVDAELLGGPQKLVLLLAHLDLAAL